MNAVAMIAAGMRLQIAPPEYGHAGGGVNEAPNTPMEMSQSDHGIDGHAGQAYARDDRRDDGTALADDA